MITAIVVVYLLGVFFTAFGALIVWTMSRSLEEKSAMAAARVFKFSPLWPGLLWKVIRRVLQDAGGKK